MLNSGICIFLRGEVDGIIRTLEVWIVLILIIRKHRLLTVVLYRTIGRTDGNTVGERNFWTGCIVVLVVYFLIGNILNIHILCRVNGKTALVECLVCLCLSITLLFHKIADDLIGQLINKIGIDAIVLQFYVD